MLVVDGISLIKGFSKMLQKVMLGVRCAGYKS